MMFSVRIHHEDISDEELLEDLEDEVSPSHTHTHTHTHKQIYTVSPSTHLPIIFRKIVGMRKWMVVVVRREVVQQQQEQLEDMEQFYLLILTSVLRLDSDYMIVRDGEWR